MFQVVRARSMPTLHAWHGLRGCVVLHDSERVMLAWLLVRWGCNATTICLPTPVLRCSLGLQAGSAA